MFGVLFLQYLVTVNTTEVNMIKVYVDEVKVYEGKKAFVDIISGGMTTTVTIYKKLFPFKIVDKYYSSNNVEIK